MKTRSCVSSFLIALLLFLALSNLSFAQDSSSIPPNNPALQTPLSTAAASFSDTPKDDIRDIYGLLPYSDLSTKIALALRIILVLAVLLLIIMLIRSYQRRRPEIILTPEEIAFSALRGAKALMQSDLSREFAFSLSTILREYIQRRYTLSKSSETTEEFLHRLSKEGSSPLQKHGPILSNFMTLCDAAKFAKASYSMDALSQIFDTAWRFVEVSAPSEPSTKESQP